MFADIFVTEVFVAIGISIAVVIAAVKIYNIYEQLSDDQ